MSKLTCRLSLAPWYGRVWLPVAGRVLLSLCHFGLVSPDRAGAVLGWSAKWAVRVAVVDR